ncbi:M28 family metallopeptidase [Mucilaginibacter dorajii]|uniref:Peptidase M28 domain-containing protein n=1 Tax=Mucilaginibacter dorajii TaxID=692994 RepID=A0ABP7P2Y5_9SPHI|nr:M28 family peptidase [Mucilaginibacter dorajii]MCS3734320.1 hypothetical protein [Mucilaginibacter dorajii]
MKRYIIIALCSCCLFTAQAQTIKQLKRDMYGIASDATEGRFTGSPGYLKAARYVAGQLKAAGLKTTFQAVPLLWDNYDGSTISINQKIYPHQGGNFIILQHAAPKPGDWVVLKDRPDSANTAALIKLKVAGVILLPNEQQAKDWETTVIRQYRFGYIHYAADYVPSQASLTIILLSPNLAEKLNKDPKTIADIRFKQDRVNGYNIIATLPGSDKNLKGQTIIAGAHLDHIGRLGGHIYNGANDDGSGCVALLAAAKTLAHHPAKRPLLFVFYCGEELNLLGSRYLMDHPPITVKNMLMNINLEQVGSRHRSFPGVWAVGDQQFKNSFFTLSKTFAHPDLKFSPTDSLRDELSNTDSYSFMKKQVPSLLLSSGGFDEHHTPQDKIDLIDFPHLQKVSRLLNQLIRQIADH